MAEWVRLKEEVGYDKLEMAISRAAADYGWRIGKQVDNYNIEWKLGSIHEDSTYGSTDIEIRRGFFGRLRRPVFSLRVFKGENTDRFLLGSKRDSPFYSGRDNEIKRFLERVGDYLEPRDPLMTAMHAARPRLG